MPSDDSKPLKKEESLEDEDDQSLGSLLKNHKKKAENASLTKSKPASAKVKKEDPGNDSVDKSIKVTSNGSRPKVAAKVKKDDDDDDEKPIAAKKPASKTEKPSQVWSQPFFSFTKCCITSDQ